MIRPILIALLTIFVLTACGRPEFGSPTSAGDDVVESDVDRDDPGLGGDRDSENEPPSDNGGADNEGEEQPAPANNGDFAEPAAGYTPADDFAFAVYHATATPGRNAVFAPHGLARSLVIAHAAVDATEAARIAGVLSPYLGTDVYGSFNAADLALENRESDELQLLGSVWAQNDVEVSDEFVDVLARYLGLQIRLVDFAGAPEDVRIAINNWHGSETQGRVTEVLGPRSVDASTRFVIADATWFSARWGFGGFDPANTMYETFRGTENEVVVPMMHTDTTLLTILGPDFDAVVMPYADGFSLLAVVPDDLAAFEENLDPDFFERLIEEAVPTDVTLRFPRIDVSDRVALSAVSDALGLGDLLSSARYPAFLDGTRLHDAHQRTRISFTELGTTATGEADDGGVPDPEARTYQAIDFDRPFIFAIRDAQTQRLLFVGRVAQP